MTRTTKKPRSRERAAAKPDTSSYERAQGAVKPEAPDRRNERLPHERDESARATGNRLVERPPPSDKQISRAREDVESGRVDTERRGIPSDLPKPKQP